MLNRMPLCWTTCCCSISFSMVFRKVRCKRGEKKYIFFHSVLIYSLKLFSIICMKYEWNEWNWIAWSRPNSCSNECVKQFAQESHVYVLNKWKTPHLLYKRSDIIIVCRGKHVVGLPFALWIFHLVARIRYHPAGCRFVVSYQIVSCILVLTLVFYSSFFRYFMRSILDATRRVISFFKWFEYPKYTVSQIWKDYELNDYFAKAAKLHTMSKSNNNSTAYITEALFSLYPVNIWLIQVNTFRETSIAKYWANNVRIQRKNERENWFHLNFKEPSWEIKSQLYPMHIAIAIQFQYVRFSVHNRCLSCHSQRIV